MRKLFLLLSFFLCTSITLMANEHTPKVNGGQKKQHARINEGISSGEQTKMESALLCKEQRHIRKAELRAKADGNVTARERRGLDRKEDRSGSHIL